MAQLPLIEILQRCFIHSQRPDKPCDICKNLPWEKELPFEGEDGMPHHSNLVDLAESAENCPLCFLIMWALGCSLANQGGMTRYGNMTLPSGRHVRTSTMQSIYSGLGTMAKGGAMIEYRRVEADIAEFLIRDPFDSVSDPTAVRPWLFGNWWRSPLGVEEAQLIGLGVRLGKGPALDEAVNNEGDTMYLSGSFIRVRTDHDEPIAGSIPGRLTTVDQSSPMAFRWLQEQITTCDKTHQCTHVKDFSPLPSRVLDVNLDDDPNYIYLVESKGRGGLYLALSHCWGTSHRITTTRENVATHRVGIVLSDLPKTFKDAVHVARELEVPYLWIDSLCILQDDPADWEAEAKLMGDVYLNAYLTISALSSEDDSSGCFADMDTDPRLTLTYVSSDARATGRPCIPRASPRILSIPAENEHDLRAYRSGRLPFHVAEMTQIERKSRLYFTFEWMPSSLKSDPMIYLMGTFGGNFDPIADSHLSSRGWVLQERILSPRIIHYSNGEMFWECQTGIQAEDGALFGRPILGVKQMLTMQREDAHDAWRQLVGEYTTRNLTYEKDKLPAISGLAQAFASIMKDTYVAGLWKSQIIQDMCWAVDTFEPTHRCDDPEHDTMLPPAVKNFYSYPKSYRAPSWSWASIDAKTEFRRLKKDALLATCIDVQVTPSSTDPFGQVSSGWMKLQGVISEIKISKPLEGHKSWQHPYTVSIESEAAKGEIVWGTAVFDSETIFPSYALWLDDDAALILRPKPGEKDTFTRIGQASFSRTMAQRTNSASRPPVPEKQHPEPKSGSKRSPVHKFLKSFRKRDQKVEGDAATVTDISPRGPRECVINIV